MPFSEEDLNLEKWGDEALTSHDKVLVNLVRVAERLRREQGAIFKKYGITFPQYNVLRVLCTYSRGKTTTSNVCRKMLVPGPNLSALLKRLENGAFLTRNRDPNDERVILLQITSKGIKTLANVEEEKNENLKKFFEGMTEKEIRNLTSTLVKILTKP